MKNAFLMAAAAAMMATMAAHGQSLATNGEKSIPGFPPQLTPEAVGLVEGGGASAAAGEAPPVTQAEIDAVQKLRGITDPAKRIDAADKFAVTFPKSALLGSVYTAAGQAAQAMKDSSKTHFYYERAIAADPTADYARLMLAVDIAQNAQPGTPSVDEELARAQKLAREGMDLVEKRKKLPNEKQQEFEDLKKDDMATGHLALGMIEMVQSKFGDAGQDFLQSVDMAKNPNAANLLRASMAFYNARMFDQSITAADRFLKTPGLPDDFVKRAEDLKKEAQKAKSAAPAK